MPSPVLHVETTAKCFHEGTVEIMPTNFKVRMDGKPVATVADAASVADCKLASTSSPPCVSVAWMVPATKVRVMGSPVLLMNSQGVGQTTPPTGWNPPGLSNGPVTIVATQMRVKGT